MASGLIFPRPRGNKSDGAARLLGADGIARRAYPSGKRSKAAASKKSEPCGPYRKRTHVVGLSILRRSSDPRPRNSANYPRNFGIRGPHGDMGRREMAQATV